MYLMAVRRHEKPQLAMSLYNFGSINVLNTHPCAKSTSIAPIDSSNVLKQCSIVERELLQNFSQLGPVWLRLARKKAPSERRSGVARSKGVLEHRAFAPRPEHEFWMTHISRKGGDAAQSRWHQKDRRHQPETSDTKKHSISTSCDHMHSIHLPMHLSTW